jgi:hypothetical protein
MIDGWHDRWLANEHLFEERDRERCSYPWITTPPLMLTPALENVNDSGRAQRTAALYKRIAYQDRRASHQDPLVTQRTDAPGASEGQRTDARELPQALTHRSPGG